MSDFIRLGNRLDGTPFDVELSKLREKMFFIQGATGQRKSLFIMSLLLQFLEFGDAIVFCDLGADRVVYWLFREACERLGVPFYCVSLDPRHDSFFIDPFQIIDGTVDENVFANAIGAGLSLVNSPGYGRSYYTIVNMDVVEDGLISMPKGEKPTFARFVEQLRVICKRPGPLGPSQAYLAAKQLSRVKYFGIAPDASRQLSLSKVLKEGGVVYLHLSSALYGSTARAIATLLSWCTMFAAATRSTGADSARVVHLAIDEFSQVAAAKSALEATLVLARKWNLSMWSVVQSAEQLKTSDGDLNPIFRDNCQRFFFTVQGEKEQRELMACSRDELTQFKGQSYQKLGSSTQVREELRPKLTRNEILEVSGRAMQLFAVLNLGDGHEDPVPIEVIPPVSRERHAELKARPLPEVPTPPTTSVTPTSVTYASPILSGKRQAHLAQLIAQKRHQAFGRP